MVWLGQMFHAGEGERGSYSTPGASFQHLQPHKCEGGLDGIYCHGLPILGWGKRT